MRPYALFLVGCLLLAVPALAADTAAGSVKNVSGPAFIVRDGQELPAQEGMRLFEGDGLRTGSDATMGVILRDDTVLSFGPDTEARLSQFLFNPRDQEYGLSLRVMQGTAAYLSGAIGRLSPESIQVETPDALLGVKGTHFLVEVR